MSDPLTIKITDPDKVWCPAARIESTNGAYSRPVHDPGLTGGSWGTLGCLGTRCPKWIPELVNGEPTGAGWCGL